MKTVKGALGTYYTLKPDEFLRWIKDKVIYHPSCYWYEIWKQSNFGEREAPYVPHNGWVFEDDLVRLMPHEHYKALGPQTNTGKPYWETPYWSLRQNQPAYGWNDQKAGKKRRLGYYMLFPKNGAGAPKVD